jgi:hypothetical protein
MALGFMGTEVKLVIAAFASGLLAGCSDDATTPKIESRMAQSQAIQIGLSAMEMEMSKAHVEKYKPYRAELEEGSWHVFGTVPGGGPGGTPEALVQDDDGAVLSVGHGQ